MSSLRGSSDREDMARSAICAATLAVVLGLVSTWSQAQAGNGSASTTKITPQQIQDTLRAQLQGRGRLGPKIENPRATDSTMNAMLRNQREAADREQQEILAAQYASGAGATHPSGPSGVRGLAGLGAQPAGGKPGPGPNKVPAPYAPCLVPEINTVNGYLKGLSFTPIAEWNLYTIKGCGFGNTPGTVYLEGPFAAGRIYLQVLSKQSHWGTTAIIGRLDPALTGELDQDNVTLVVEPPGAAPIKRLGFKFYAARETVLLPMIPRALVVFGDSGSDPLQYASPSVYPLASSASVSRVAASHFGPGTDIFNIGSSMPSGFGTLAIQFEVFQGSVQDGQLDDKYSWHGAQQGQDLDYANPKLWEVHWDKDDFAITWREWPVTTYIQEGQNQVPAQRFISDYYLNVWVKGPRGVDPWGRPALAPMPKFQPATHS